MKFSKLAQQLSGSATMAATLKAQELKRLGQDVVLATVGEPDVDVELNVKNSLLSQLQSQPSRYGPSTGLLSTRQALSDWFQKIYQTHYSAQQIVITPGSKFGLYSLMQILCDADDEVIIPAPYWVSYITLAEMAKARACVISPPNLADLNYKLTAEHLEKSLNSKSRILILNSPNNPSGAVYSKKELLNLADVLNDHPQVTVICDDIYNQLVFNSDTERAPSLLDVANDALKKQIIIVHGASKSYAMTGWRLGWIASLNDECIQKLSAFYSQTLTCTPDFIQKAVETAVSEGDHFVHQFKLKNKNRHQWLQQQLQSIPGLRVYPSEGAFYIWIQLLDSSCNSQQVAEELLTKENLAVVPGDAFGVPRHLRISVTMSEAELKKTVERLQNYFLKNRTTI